MTVHEQRGLSVTGLQKRFDEVVALRDLSFHVGPGDIFGFVGSNGAGKSTTMRIILGVLAPDAGEVRFDGAPVDAVLRRRIGYMPEERGLYPKMKVGDQLVYLARLHGLSKGAAAERMTTWTTRLGIEARVGDNVADLSLGNQQRVQLAAALIADPAVLVLDEPFSGLDPVAVDVMSDVLREKAAEGLPVIFSSHQLELVERLCSSVGIIAGGQMRSTGPVSELRARGGTRLVVDAPDAPAGWADGLPGITSVDYGPTTRLTVTAEHDDQAVLHRALAHGPVHRLTAETPTLTELFREVVTTA